MNFTAWIQSHRRSVLFLLALVVIGGLAAGLRLPVALFPQVDFPRIVISLDAGDRPVERMTNEVTMPVEEAVRAVPGLRSLRSTSSRGSADISVNFDWGADMTATLLQVQAALSQVLPSLPPGTTFEVRRRDPTVFPVIAYSLTSERRSLVELRDLATYTLRPLIASVPGVSRVEVQGGAEAEYHVIIGPGQLEAHGLTLDDVAKALAAAGPIRAIGRIEEHDQLYLALVDNHPADQKSLGETVLKKGPLGLVRVADIGTVVAASVPSWHRVTADGREAVILQLYQQPDGNVVQIARDVRERVTAECMRLPADVKIAAWYDQSVLVSASAASVRDAVLIGVLLAGAVLWLFLRNGRITLIAMVCVPAVLAATVLLLYLIHASFNIMTLGGMAAAVGLVIDDAIVMVEHIIRRLRGHAGRPHHGLVWAAAGEFTRPLVGSSLSTIVVFAPLAFLSGVTGAFFKALSLTMASCLVISFLVAWLAVPILADRFLGERDALQKEGGAFTARVHRFYERLMRRLLGRPWLVLFGVVPLLVMAWIGYRQVGSGFLPSMDEGGFILDYRAAPGTSLAETDRLLRQVETILQATPEVATYSRRTGMQLGGGLTESNEGDFFVRLKPPPRRDIDEVIANVRGRVEHAVPGLNVEMAQLMEDVIGDLTAVPQPVEIKLFSDDAEVLATVGPKIAGIIGKIPGMVDIRDGILPSGDVLLMEVDRAKAALEGMDPTAVSSALGDLLGGVPADLKIERGPRIIGVRAWIPARDRMTADMVARLRLRAPDGHFFPLLRVATVQTVSGQPQIQRDNLQRMIAVTARLSGRDLGSGIRDVRAALAKPGVVPANVRYELGGTYAEQRKAFAGLLAVFGGAVALVFLLLLFLYEKFSAVAAILVCTFLSLSAVSIGLWLTGTELNISSMMGMTMIVGITTEVAIFYMSELSGLPDDLAPHDALITAGLNRMRPIAMTTVTAILALLPLAFALGTGSAMQQPLAVAIVSGLCLQMPVMLVVLPTILSLRAGSTPSFSPAKTYKNPSS